MQAEPATHVLADSQPRPRLRRRLTSLIYEGILVFGVAFIAAYLFLALTQSKYPIAAPMRYLFQLYMLAIVGLYFVWCWRHGGQTLPMKTWKIRLVAEDGGVPSLARAWWRYALVWLSLAPALALYAWGVRWGLALIVLPFLWPLLDRERLFLHDRLARTRLISVAGVCG